MCYIVFIPRIQRPLRPASVFSMMMMMMMMMHYGKGNIGYMYSMNGQSVEEVDSEKDLGITFTTDLKATAHCQEAYSKANRMLGLISRTIQF